METRKREYPQWAYKALLLAAAAIWGLGTVVVKGTVDSLPPGWLVGIRFLASGIVLSVVLLPRMRRSLDADHLRAGALLGAFVALAYLCNSTGLTDTTASKSSFLTATYCILMPFLAWAVLSKRPTGFNLVAALLCIAGVGFVSLQSTGALSLGFGDAVTLLSAVFLGMHLVLTSKLAPGRDIMVLTAVQFVVAGLAGLAWGAVAEPVPAPALFDAEMLANLAYLVLAASCLALLLQNVGVAHVAPAPASLFLATESVFGVLFSVAFLGEALNAQMLAGFALIAFAIVVSEYLPSTAWGERRAGRRRPARS